MSLESGPSRQEELSEAERGALEQNLFDEQQERVEEAAEGNTDLPQAQFDTANALSLAAGETPLPDSERPASSPELSTETPAESSDESTEVPTEEVPQTPPESSEEGGQEIGESSSSASAEASADRKAMEDKETESEESARLRAIHEAGLKQLEETFVGKHLIPNLPDVLSGTFLKEPPMEQVAKENKYWGALKAVGRSWANTTMSMGANLLTGAEGIVDMATSPVEKGKAIGKLFTDSETRSKVWDSLKAAWQNTPPEGRGGLAIATIVETVLTGGAASAAKTAGKNILSKVGATAAKMPTNMAQKTAKIASKVGEIADVAKAAKQVTENVVKKPLQALENTKIGQVAKQAADKAPVKMVKNVGKEATEFAKGKTMEEGVNVVRNEENETTTA